MQTSPRGSSQISAELPLAAPVREALEAILAGATPDSLEGPHLDFKEDPAAIPGFSGNPDARRAEMLLEASLCFANADGEAHLILGVADRRTGADAFTGTAADPEDVREKIFNRSTPNLTVEISEIMVAGQRLLDLRIPQGLAVYSRRNGAASRRVGTSCRPLTDEERAEITFRRRNPDLTARASHLSPSALDPAAVHLARRLMAQRDPDQPLGSDEDLLRRLGVLTTDGTLLEAGAILLGHRETHPVTARHLWRRQPSGEPSSAEYDGPMLTTLRSIQERIHSLSDPEVTRIQLPHGQEIPVANFPHSAIDESISNAFIHRDWSSTLPITVDQSPVTFKVTSPGGLPRGVREDRLLSTPSRPRNVTLMRALHRLGLAEDTSRGFDRMWVSMLTRGRPAPAVDVDPFSVTVTFTADRVDGDFVRWLYALEDSGVPGDVVRALNTLLSLRHLESAPTITTAKASSLMQIGEDEARAQLGWLTSAGLLTESTSVREWQLAEKAREALSGVGGNAPLAGAVEQWILSAVESGATVTNRSASQATGADSRTVTATLRYLSDTHRIQKDPEEPSRGPTVRWISRR